MKLMRDRDEVQFENTYKKNDTHVEFAYFHAYNILP